MQLILSNPSYRYEIENLCRLFLPDVRFNDDKTESGDYVNISCADNNIVCQVRIDSATYEKTASYIDEVDGELISAVCLYNILSEHLGFKPAWGVLTGVRPAKLFSKLTYEKGTDYAENYFKEKLLVSSDKIELCKHASRANLNAASFNSKRAFSLYVSIPFCPSRCSYCSFVSHSIEKAQKLMEPYVELLCREIVYVAKIAHELSLELKTIYFGGGTPTTLSATQLETVMTTISNNFDLSGLLEYTVEAGRPDTVTEQKLITLLKNSCTRISINPQTMSDDILCNIGRKHTVQQTIDAFLMARSVGFKNINMDLIAGLTGDTLEGFDESLNRVLCQPLGPENVTVHTLSLKRSSKLVSLDKTSGTANSMMISRMLEIASKKLFDKGYKPYYLYRQSKMLGNLENVGWSKSGYDCLYNIYMMDELHTVLSVGAGGVTRLKNPNGNEIQRVFNYKFPYEYNQRFDEMLNRKKQIGEFYDTYPAT